MREHTRLERDSNKLEKEECERKKEGKPNRTFLHLRLNLLILIGLILISQFLNIYFSLAFYFILFSFYLFWLPWPGTVYAVPQYPAVPVYLFLRQVNR